MGQKLLIYSDGGARGNPGPAAAAYVAQNEQSETVKTDAKFIGYRTNNQAEYEALLLALGFAVDQKATEVICHLDSELVVKQLRGEYAVKDTVLQGLNRQVKAMLGCFTKVSFVNVRRSHPQISRADALVNEMLDAEAAKPQQTHIHGRTAKEEAAQKGIFAHTSIRTSNMQRSIDFYSRHFGLMVRSRHEIKATNAEIAFLQDPKGKGCTLELTLYRDQTEFQQPQYEKRLFDHLGFEVGDIEKTLTTMKQAGVTVTDEPTQFSEHTTIAFVEDPDGTLIELSNTNSYS
ncbi:MAG: VOC family protein [Candidatus Bathyarchaeia archaeon]|jgi:lactoylglutathione lyase